MADKMTLDDGTNSVTFSPILSPIYDRPDSRYRGSFRPDSGDVQLYDLGGGRLHTFTLNNLTKTEADRINGWWDDLTILNYIVDGTTTSIFADLNGTTQYFYRSDADFPESGIIGATDFTIQAWIRPDDLPGTMYIVNKYQAASDMRMYRFILFNTGELGLGVSSDGTAGTHATRRSTNADIVVGTWTHVAVTYDASAGSCIFYQDGAALTDDAVALPNTVADKTPDFAIGATDIQLGGAQFFDGSVDNAALLTGIRTPAQILASFQNRDEDLSGAGGIVGQWRFNDDADATFIDNSEGDLGRDLIPYDGGDDTYGNVGRTVFGIHARIQGTQAPIQMWFPTGFQEKYEGALTIHEVSSSSSGP